MYKNILAENEIEYIIISWDRNNDQKEYDEFTYLLYSPFHKTSLKRYIDYIKYSKFIKDVINKEHIDFLIVCTIAPSFFLYNTLKNRFREKYIIDIRDYSPLANVFKKTLKSLLRNSALNIISSSGFLTWLPQNTNYQICHNLPISKSITKNEFYWNKNEPIIILSIGYFQNYESAKLIVDKLGNDERFLLKFAGKGEALDRIMLYCVNEIIKNIEMYGEFTKEDEDEIYQSAHIVNIYNLDDIGFKTLITNKFYRSVINNVPMLTRENTLQGQYATQFNIGLSVDNNEVNFGDKIIEYLSNLDRKEFYFSCVRYFETIVAEQNRLVQILERVFKN